jgi:hypothetical protein
LSVAFFVNQLATFILGAALTELLDSLVSDRMNPTSFLAIGLTRRRQRDETAKSQRVWLEHEIRLTTSLEVPIAVSMRRALLTLRLYKWYQKSWYRHLWWQELVGWSSKATVSNGNLLLPIPDAI